MRAMELDSEYVRRTAHDDGIVIEGGALLRTLAKHMADADAERLVELADRCEAERSMPDLWIPDSLIQKQIPFEATGDNHPTAVGR